VRFQRRFWAGLADGSVTMAVRRWKRPSVKAGGTMQTAIGLLHIDSLEVVRPEEVSDADARACGYADRGAALADLRPEGELYRVRFHLVGPDPRIELRSRAELDDGELEELRRALNRLEWALPALRLIADNPGVVSTELAPQLGMERYPFKDRVRRLKALGLTESLDVGYRLSPRGEAVLARLE
jgi:hypothetical protein